MTSTDKRVPTDDDAIPPAAGEASGQLRCVRLEASGHPRCVRLEASGHLRCVRLEASGHPRCVRLEASGHLRCVRLDASGHPRCVRLEASGHLRCVRREAASSHAPRRAYTEALTTRRTYITRRCPSTKLANGWTPHEHPPASTR